MISERTAILQAHVALWQLRMAVKGLQVFAGYEVLRITPSPLGVIRPASHSVEFERCSQPLTT